MPEPVEWVHLYNPSQQAWHRVPDNEAVIQDFQDRGWETPDESAARAELEATQLRGKALDEALDAAGLPHSGTVKEKQAALAAFNADQVIAVSQAVAFEQNPQDQATEANEDEGEKV